MPKVSKFSDELGKLGFEPISPELEMVFNTLSALQFQKAGVYDAMKTNRHKRRAIAKVMNNPRPSVAVVRNSGEPRTYVTDELGKRWIIDKAIDPSPLIALGFEDTSEDSERSILAAQIVSANENVRN